MQHYTSKTPLSHLRTSYSFREGTRWRNGWSKLSTKVLSGAALLLMAMTVPLFAQTSASQSVTVEATVLQGLKVTVSGGPLNFGSLVAGTTPPAITAQSSSVMYTITGNGASNVKVTYAATTLSGPGTNTLDFTPSVYGASSSSSQSSSTEVPTGSTVSLTGSNGSAGNYFLWLGGDIGAIPSNQTPGSYSGTFTLTVSY